MIYYLRFVKVPEVAVEAAHSASGRATVATTKTVVMCSFDIRNDLGDVRLDRATSVSAILFDARTKSRISSASIRWQGTEWSREVRVYVPSSTSSSETKEVILRLSAQTPVGEPGIPEAGPALLTATIQSEALPLQKGSRTNLLAQRLCFASSGRPMPTPWERVGTSIFGHVWDAGTVLSAHLLEAGGQKSDATASSAVPSPLLQLLSSLNSAGPLQVLELGSGIGLVSIALAYSFRDCVISPSDTEDACDNLLSRNVTEAAASLRLLSQLKKPVVLHWDDKAHRKRVAAQKWGLLLLSDCTYNTASVPALVATISAVASSSTLIVVALKRRHEDEVIFYQMMKNACFSVVHHQAFDVPTQGIPQDGTLGGQIELYQYKKS